MICSDCRLSAHAVLSVVGVGRICVPCFKARKREQHIGRPATANIMPPVHHIVPETVLVYDEPPTIIGAVSDPDPVIHTYFGPVPLSVFA